MAERPWPGHFKSPSFCGLRSPRGSPSLAGTEQPLHSGVLGGCSEASSGSRSGPPHGRLRGRPTKGVFLGLLEQQVISI